MKLSAESGWWLMGDIFFQPYWKILKIISILTAESGKRLKVIYFFNKLENAKKLLVFSLLNPDGG
jgi:hypothetical protein